MKKYLFLGCLLLSIATLAQTEEEDAYTTENTFGIGISTNSGLPGGVSFKHSRQITARSYHNFVAEIVSIKHPKELKYTNQYNGGPYIWDKLNYFYSLRLTYGREWILFRKAPEEGVQISVHANAGPAIGLLKPYYIEYNFGSPSNPQIVREAYDPARHTSQDRINGSSGLFWLGFDEIKAQLGGHLKAGMSFEFGAFRNNVTGIDIGLSVDAFTQKIPIMARPDNNSVYSSAYLVFFFGSRN